MNNSLEIFQGEADDKDGEDLEHMVWRDAVDFINNPDQEKIILEKIGNPENYLGEGGAAMVFDVGEDRCVKLMKNRHNSPNAHMYDLGNSPRDEAGIQNMLKDFEVAGVFTPTIFSQFHGVEASAIVMEKLDAVNLQLVLNGEEEMPAGFDPDDFFKRLREFIVAMHDKKGIVHADLELRNVMVDRQTAHPRVIDFGRSKLRDRQERLEYVRAAKGEIDKLNKMYSKVRTHFQK